MKRLAEQNETAGGTNETAGGTKKNLPPWQEKKERNLQTDEPYKM